MRCFAIYSVGSELFLMTIFLFFYREDMGFKLVAEQVRVNRELKSRLLFGFKSA